MFKKIHSITQWKADANDDIGPSEMTIEEKIQKKLNKFQNKAQEASMNKSVLMSLKKSSMSIRRDSWKQFATGTGQNP